nr:type II toxin-antitoxin system PemK/MazF family toxin [Bradyrhizobium sp.]
MTDGALPSGRNRRKPTPRMSVAIALHRPSAAKGLRLRSQIMTDKINALRRDRIRRVLGSLDSETCERLNSALMTVTGLAR